MKPESLKKRTILAVDDKLENLKVLIKYLEDSGFDLMVAQNGEEALKNVERIIPDMILLDVLMPGIDGFETCRRVKANETTRDIPIIFMTALTETVDKVRGFKAGAVDYLTKPLQYEEVLARVNAHMTIRKFQQQLQEQNVLLQQMNTQLEEKDRIKNEYVSRVTHDIKGHLSTIQSCLYLGIDESSGLLNEKQADLLGRALNRTLQLTKFEKELLNLTQMRLVGKQEMTTLSLADCISKAITNMEGKVKDKSIKVNTNIDSSIGHMIGDEFSIDEMITNLLSNAIKYTPENKTVRVEAKDCCDHVQIDISDTGIGMYRTGLFGNWVSERFLLVKLLNLEKSKGTERWELSQI